jgi:hypothetical protein
MKTRRFYDIHFHSMDLSHPNLTAFIDKMVEGIKVDKTDVKNIVRKIGWIRFVPVPACVLSWCAGTVIKVARKLIVKKDLLKSANRARNLLSFMENPVEYFLKNPRPENDQGFTPPLIENGILKIGDDHFNKIVLCPLIIDFGYKNLKQTGVYYNIPPEKPVKKQITDLFGAIRMYYHNSISPETVSLSSGGKNTLVTKFKTVRTDYNPGEKLFEIYPLMGINTANYDYDSISAMLDKYFSEFSGNDTPDERYAKLRSRLGKFTGNLDNEENCRNIFAGIKVYPPLGFDPWPARCENCSVNGDEGCKCELSKVKLVYRFCTERNIPVITHCSDGGFVADPDYLRITNPANRWADVLSHFPGLRIDFAHFGRGNEQWESKIKEYLTDRGLNVYTDFSCNTEGNDYYRRLEEMTASLHVNDKLPENILFGSDFMINMLWIESYNFYINEFAESPFLRKYKSDFCHSNPERFLFGGSLSE